MDELGRRVIGDTQRSGEFTTTRWTVVLTAGQEDSERREAALEELCRTYWYPVYAYIRRSGHSSADAQDLTQDFFTTLLRRDALASLTPRLGRFRSFLLTCLRHFLTDALRRAQAVKRGGHLIRVPLEDEQVERYYASDSTAGGTPEQLFEQHWALALLDRSYSRLESEYGEAGKAREFARLKEFLARDTQAGDYESVAKDLGLSTGAVSVAVHRLRQRYRELVRKKIAQTLENSGEVDDELRQLFGR
jgi:RNA polymerase sigma-70 factor (ECF subfamily)